MTPIWATGRHSPGAGARDAVARCPSTERARSARSRRVDRAKPRDPGPKGRAGFTLVELLMVVAILGLAAGAVVLAVPDPRPAVGVEAERFAARLARAREEAVLSNRPAAVEVTSIGYAFSVYDGRGWSVLSEGPFGPETWQAGTMPDPAAGARFVFDPTGGAEPLALTLVRDGKRVVVAVDGAGEVRIDG